MADILAYVALVVSIGCWMRIAAIETRLRRLKREHDEDLQDTQRSIRNLSAARRGKGNGHGT